MRQISDNHVQNILGHLQKIKQKLIYELKMPPLPPKSMLSVYMMTLGPWHSNLRQFNFFEKN